MGAKPAMMPRAAPVPMPARTAFRAPIPRETLCAEAPQPRPLRDRNAGRRG
jgi:hypothetical protein